MSEVTVHHVEGNEGSHDENGCGDSMEEYDKIEDKKNDVCGHFSGHQEWTPPDWLVWIWNRNYPHRGCMLDVEGLILNGNGEYMCLGISLTMWRS